jgi:hypothetical protein
VVALELMVEADWVWYISEVAMLFVNGKAEYSKDAVDTTILKYGLPFCSIICCSVDAVHLLSWKSGHQCTPVVQ